LHARARHVLLGNVVLVCKRTGIDPISIDPIGVAEHNLAADLLREARQDLDGRLRRTYGTRSLLLMVLAEVISQSKWLWYRNTGAARKLFDIQIFDQASRGPWGSFKMFWFLKHW
jgi:hypothetical protein